MIIVSNGDQRERWRGESDYFQVETKFYSKHSNSVKWSIRESHRRGHREINISEACKVWICRRLSWKSSHPGINTGKIRRVEGGTVVYIIEKQNQWGFFVAIQVEEFNHPSQFIIIPGGLSGELWFSFGSWLLSGTAPEIGVTEPQSSSKSPIRSFADVVRRREQNTDTMVERDSDQNGIKEELERIRLQILEITRNIDILVNLNKATAENGGCCCRTRAFWEQTNAVARVTSDFLSQTRPVGNVLELPVEGTGGIGLSGEEVHGLLVGLGASSGTIHIGPPVGLGLPDATTGCEPSVETTGYGLSNRLVDNRLVPVSVGIHVPVGINAEQGNIFPRKDGIDHPSNGDTRPVIENAGGEESVSETQFDQSEESGI